MADRAGPESAAPKAGNCTTCGEPLEWRGRNPSVLQCVNPDCPTMDENQCGVAVVDCFTGQAHPCTKPRGHHGLHVHRSRAPTPTPDPEGGEDDA